MDSCIDSLYHAIYIFKRGRVYRKPDCSICHMISGCGGVSALRSVAYQDSDRHDPPPQPYTIIIYIPAYGCSENMHERNREKILNHFPFYFCHNNIWQWLKTFTLHLSGLSLSLSEVSVGGHVVPERLTQSMPPTCVNVNWGQKYRTNLLPAFGITCYYPVGRLGKGEAGKEIMSGEVIGEKGVWGGVGVLRNLRS